MPAQQKNRTERNSAASAVAPSRTVTVYHWDRIIIFGAAAVVGVAVIAMWLIKSPSAPAIRSDKSPEPIFADEAPVPAGTESTTNSQIELPGTQYGQPQEAKPPSLQKPAAVGQKQIADGPGSVSAEEATTESEVLASTESAETDAAAQPNVQMSDTIAPAADQLHSEDIIVVREPDTAEPDTLAQTESPVADSPATEIASGNATVPSSSPPATAEPPVNQDRLNSEDSGPGPEDSAPGPAPVVADVSAPAAETLPLDVTPREPRISILSEHIRRLQLVWDIQSLEPVNPVTDVIRMKDRDLIKVYLFTELSQLTDRTVYHDWYMNDERVARVAITPFTSPMRASSSKNINPYMLGDWRAEVITKDGEKLAEVFFEVAQ